MTETLPVEVPPVLVTVKSCVPEIWPATTVPKSWLVGVIVRLPGARPVPDRATDPLPPTLAETMIEPVTAPGAVGANWTRMLQDALPDNVVMPSMQSPGMPVRIEN